MTSVLCCLCNKEPDPFAEHLPRIFTKLLQAAGTPNIALEDKKAFRLAQTTAAFMKFAPASAWVDVILVLLVLALSLGRDGCSIPRGTPNMGKGLPSKSEQPHN